MKKLIAILLFSCIFMNGCAIVGLTTHQILNNPITEEIANEVKTAAEDIAKEIDSSVEAIKKTLDDYDEEALLDATKEHLEVLDTVINESFGVERGQAFYATYPENRIDSIEYGELDDDAELIKSGDNPKNGYIIEPTLTTYFEVLNYRTEDELEAYFESYIDDDLFDEYVDDYFEEYKGKLYAVSGSRGQGATSLDLSSARIISKQKDSVVVKLTRLLFDEPFGDCFVTLEYKNGGFIIESLENE